MEVLVVFSHLDTSTLRDQTASKLILTRLLATYKAGVPSFIIMHIDFLRQNDVVAVIV